MNLKIHCRFGLMSETVNIMAERGSQDDHMNNDMEDIHKEINGQQSIEDYEISSEENKIGFNENRNMENKEMVEPERCVSDLVITLVKNENSLPENSGNSGKPEIMEEENNEKAEENGLLENSSMVENSETENTGKLENLEADNNEKAEYSMLENSSMTENNKTDNSGKPENIEADNCKKEHGGAKNNENGGNGDLENDNVVEIYAENETIYNKKENDKQETNEKDFRENDIITNRNESTDGNCDELIADESIEADVRPTAVDNVEEDETAVVPMHHIALQKLDDIIGMKLQTTVFICILFA
ncbi:unnamed protein product [Owenia fusiformis]|uniref:Uncharacterized protein n=1 Tax=Owenia fusiformis TaxID=6347 RepID=A0A8J1T6E7_OWEFU|nr:unnamed protein product [Owenia fusiformis]